MGLFFQRLRELWEGLWPLPDEPTLMSQMKQLWERKTP